MATRDIDEKRRSWLASEVEAWRAQGLVNSEQAAGILALYGTTDEQCPRCGAFETVRSRTPNVRAETPTPAQKEQR